MEIKRKIGAVIATALSIVLFAQGFYYCMKMIKVNAKDTMQTAEIEPMAVSAVTVEYESEPALAPQEAVQSDPVERMDVGCSHDLYYGWDGRTMAEWELDLFSRIFMLEFWGSSDVLCEAGCDAILRLWEKGEFGPTMGELLTAVNAAGKYVYSTYAYVWDWNYDLEGLKWCREYCLERFQHGPEWSATYFQKWGYPDWGEWTPVPCYEIDGIYFSVGME